MRFIVMRFILLLGFLLVCFSNLFFVVYIQDLHIITRNTKWLEQNIANSMTVNSLLTFTSPGAKFFSLCLDNLQHA